MSFKIDTSDFKKYEDRLKKYPEITSKYAKEALKKASLLMERQIKIESPVDTGKLRQSVKSEISGLTALAYPTAGYAMAVEQGRGEVMPIRAKALKIRVKGTTRFIYRKKSKKTKANPFMQRSFAKVSGQIYNLFGDAIDKILKEI